MTPAAKIGSADATSQADPTPPPRAPDVRLDEITARLTMIERSLEALAADRSTVPAGPTLARDQPTTES